MSKDLQWLDGNSISIKDIEKIEKKFNIKFPKDYIECVLENDGGYPISDTYNLYGSEEVFNNLISLNEETEGNILEINEAVKDRLITNIIPFAEDPFGNLLCFDYRNKDILKIVFWNHEKAFIDKEKAISIICESFTELLDKLYESEED